jgi:DNA-binding MarR family transcriptional regulator
MDKPKVTRALQRLEARNLVQRAVVSADRRQVRLTLTRRGRLQFRQIAALALEWEAKLLGGLSSAERSAFDRVLTKLMRQVETLSPNETPAAARG